MLPTTSLNDYLDVLRRPSDGLLNKIREFAMQWRPHDRRRRGHGTWLEAGRMKYG